MQGILNNVAAGTVTSAVTGGLGEIVDSTGTVIGSTDGISGDIISGVNDEFDVDGLNSVLKQLSCIVQDIVNTGSNIIGQILQIGESILKVPFSILAGFKNNLITIIENLVNLSSTLVNSFTDAIKKIADIGTGVATTFDNFFQKTLGLFIDFLVRPALSAANTAYAKVSVAVTKATAAAKVTIQGLVSDFDDKIKEAVALAANKVTNLAADLTKTLNSSAVSAVIIAECETELKLSLVEFAANTLPNIASCIQYSASCYVTDFANKAIATVNSTSDNAKLIVASIQECLVEVLAFPKDSKAKDTARTCILGVSNC